MALDIDFDQRLHHLTRMEEILDAEFSNAPAKWIVVLDEAAEFLGGVIYNCFSKWDCHMHVASVSPRFINAKTLKVFFGYPFLQLNYCRVTGVVRESNQKALDFDLRLGFQVEGFARNGFGTEGAVLLGMLKEDCKWIR